MKEISAFTPQWEGELCLAILSLVQMKRTDAKLAMAGRMAPYEQHLVQLQMSMHFHIQLPIPLPIYIKTKFQMKNENN